jgi:hypothetical protein
MDGYNYIFSLLYLLTFDVGLGQRSGCLCLL